MNIDRRGVAELNVRQQELLKLLQENGVTYNVYGDSNCRYQEDRDYEPTPDDGTAFVGYISCDTWGRMFCYKNVTLILDCAAFISMHQRLRCAWIAYHGGA